MVWCQRIINLLSNLNIKNFLHGRIIRVRANDNLSNKIEMQNGVSQGSVLSVILFLIAVYDVIDQVKAPTKCCLFADDLTILCSGKNINTTEKIIQNSLDKLYKWTTTTGFMFSPIKSNV